MRQKECGYVYNETVGMKANALDIQITVSFQTSPLRKLKSYFNNDAHCKHFQNPLLEIPSSYKSPHFIVPLYLGNKNKTPSLSDLVFKDVWLLRW